MIILHHNSHGGIVRVCMRIFTTALRNKTIRQILNENNSPYFHSVSLVIRPFTLMKRIHFSELSISRFSTYIRKARWKPGNGQLAKMGSFYQRKWSDNKRYAVGVRWGIFIQTNSYNSAMTVIVQDDHLTAGAWAACGYSNVFKPGIWFNDDKGSMLD